MTRDRILPIALLVTLIYFMFGCATVSSPQGGPRDSLAPILVGSGPAPYTTNYQGEKVVLVFDEYVKLVDQSKEFFTSPPMANKPVLTVKGRTITAQIKDTLLDETTYRLDFGNSIADNNEGNRLRDFSFIFSTGETIDSLYMTGQTIDALTKDTLINTFIMFYDSAADSLVKDSTVYNSLAQVMVRSDSAGVFVADILRDMDYRIYALADENGNQKYEAGVDMIGFMDSTYNPTQMPEIMLSFDSLERRWEILNPQVNFEMFVEEPPRRQTILESKRTDALRMHILFNSKGAQIDTLNFLNVDQGLISEQWNPTRDTLTLWIEPQTQAQIDSLPREIKARIAYQRQDSLWQSYSHGENITFSNSLAGAKAYVMTPEDSARMVAYNEWKAQKEAKRLAKLAKRGKLEQDSIRRRKAFVADSIKREKKIADSIKNAAPAKNPFKITVNSSNQFIPLSDLTFDFQYPLRRFDKDSISLMVTPVEDDSQGGGKKLTSGSEAEAVAASFVLERDSVLATRWHLRRDWVAGEKYQMEILSGAIENMAFESNDTLKSSFTVASADDYGTLIYQFKNDSLQNKAVTYIVQLIKGQLKKDSKPTNQVIFDPATDSDITLKYISEGEYQIRIIEDLNNNGIWDTGSLDERRHPERVRIWNHNGSREVVSKQNWELPIEINLTELFNN